MNYIPSHFSYMESFNLVLLAGVKIYKMRVNVKGIAKTPHLF